MRANDGSLIYKGRLISKLLPSGYYEVYSDADCRFWKFDSLDDAKALIDSEEENGK